MSERVTLADLRPYAPPALPARWAGPEPTVGWLFAATVVWAYVAWGQLLPGWLFWPLYLVLCFWGGRLDARRAHGRTN